MPDSKITALTSISTSTDPANDPLVIVDLSDTSMAATGTTKKVTLNQLLGASGTATLASATITGAATVGTTFGVTGVSTFAAGTALLPALTTTGDTNTGIYYPAADTFAVTTAGTERYRVDSSGNVGIGVTPSAWGRGKGLEVGSIGNGFWGDSSGNGIVSISANAYLSTADLITGWKYASTNPAGRYQISETTHSWYTAISGTINTAITFTQAMTLDASGRLGVGVVPASNTRTHFKGSSTSTDYINYCVNSSDKLAFGIRNDGLMITGPSVDSATLPNSPYNLTSGSAANVFVDSQGIFYRSTSSLKYKTDIADSTRGLADVLKLRPVTYKAKNSGDTVFGGLIAEEVDAAGLTEFVQYAPDNTPDAIHYGNMVSLLVAAIQELTARVQTLETR